MTTAKSASRKQTEASPQMEAFRLLFENHPVSMWVYDLETLGFLAVNEAAQEKYGYSRDEFLGMTLKDIRPLEDISRLQADVERARPALQHSGLWRHRLKDGTLIDIEITSHTIEYEGRKAALVLAQNVTERTQAERALQVSDDRYHAFVQNSSEAIWCLELDSPLSATLPLEQQVDWLYTHASVVDCNDAMAVMHAYASREEMLGLQLSRLLPRLSPDNLKMIRDFIGNGYQINERESVELSHDVELRYFVSSLTGIVEESALRRIWGVKRDVTEHKRAEATLHESEELFRATFEQAAVGIAHVALDGRWLKVNQRICDIVGYTRAELLTKTFQGITHPDDLNTQLENLRQLLANEIEKYAMEKRYIRKDGSIVWINLTVALVRASTGEPKYFISVVEDITERKRVEQQLSESEKRFSTVFFTNPVSQSVLSQNTGLVVEVNDACCSLYGYSRAELLGADPGQLDLWVDPAAQLPILDELQRTGHLLPTEVKIRRKSGEIHTVLFAVELLNWTGIPCLLTSSIDITERKQAEAEILRRNTELTALNTLGRRVNQTIFLKDVISEAVDEMIETTQADVAFLFLRDGERLTLAGIGPQSAVEKFGEIPQHRVGECMCGLAVREGKPLYSRDIYTDMRCTWEECKKAGYRSLAALPLHSGKEIIGVLGMASSAEYDFEPQSKFLETLASQVSGGIRNAQLYEKIQRHAAELEQRVAERTAELQAANKELEAFAYSVSHDLRAPLRAMEGFSSSLLSSYSDQLDDEGRHYLDRIQQASQRMGQLINDLLNLSRITRSEFNFQRVDMSALARAITAELKTRDLQREAEFMIAEPLIVQGDAHLLRIALQNVLENAWKFSSTRPKSVIEVGQMTLAEYQLQNPGSALPFEISNGSAIYFIRDNGVGFDMTYADKLFSPFQRLHAMHEFPGTGIGLAIVERVITRHGGRVWPQAQVGQGATFYFTLGGIA